MLLLAQKFINGREVLLGIARVGEDSIDLMGERSERIRRRRRRGGVLNQSQVLRHQSRAKAAFVVVAGGSAVFHAGHRIVYLGEDIDRRWLSE